MGGLLSKREAVVTNSWTGLSDFLIGDLLLR